MPIIKITYIPLGEQLGVVLIFPFVDVVVVVGDCGVGCGGKPISELLKLN